MIEWTNIKDKMPEERVSCIVWFKNCSMVFLGWYFLEKDIWITKRNGYHRTRKVTHWSLLNKPE